MEPKKDIEIVPNIYPYSGERAYHDLSTNGTSAKSPGLNLFYGKNFLNVTALTNLWTSSG